MAKTGQLQVTSDFSGSWLKDDYKEDDSQVIKAAGNMMEPISSGGSGSSNLVDVSSNIENFGMSVIQTQSGALSHPAHRSWQESMPFTEVYGRDEEKQRIVELLLKDELGARNYEVISLVGFGGIGKTSLAQWVFNDDWMDSHFVFKAWVCVSDAFDLPRVTTKLIASATHRSASSTDLTQLQEILNGLLRGKRFLIVLDDIWNENCDTWRELQSSLSQGSNGSKVIVTTSSQKVAKMVGIKNPSRHHIIELSSLSDDCSWHLFQKLLGEVFEPEMQDVIKVCRGSPLAIKTLAGLLRKEDKSNWPKIIKGLESEGVGVMPILRLSYHHLPSHLKRCLAYCAIFPKHYAIEKEKLILMWMAEGFLPENGRMEMEDLGDHYILDLVSRLLFDPSPSGEGFFTMHDLIHDLAQWAAGESCCLMDYGKISSRARHISFTEDAKDETFGSLAMTLEATDKVRTLASFVRDSGFSTVQALDVSKFSYLRVLSFAHTEIKALPKSIGQLLHLRYLDFSSTEIIELPRSVGRLLNLQTLDLAHCRKLAFLDNSTVNLSKLRHLDISGTSLMQMPLGFGKLSNLRTLNQFVLSNGRGWTIRELKNLKYLRVLYINGLEHVVSKDDALEAKLYEKSNLLELHLYWESCANEVDDNTKRSVLEQLRPSTSIKKLFLVGYKGLSFPAWLEDFSFTNLVVLHLVACEYLECLPPLGHLPSLKELWVEGMHSIKQVGSEFYGPLSSSNPFPALRTLAFWRMQSWENWSHLSFDNKWAFPCLQKLSIMYCPSLLVCLPPHLPSLKVLEIRHCYELRASLPTLPLLEQLEIEQCKELLSTTAAISCSRRMKLGYISGAIRLPGVCPDFLEELCIFNCQNLKIVDQIPTMLRRLKIYDCEELQSVECGEILLEQVIIHGCESMTSLFCRGVDETLTAEKSSFSVSKKEQGISLRDSIELVRLTQLTISHCHSLSSLPKGLLLPCIKVLELSNCENIEALPSQMHQYTSLKSLIVFDCPKIQSFSSGNLPKNLTSLRISRVNLQQPIQEWGLHRLTSLCVLQLNDVGSSSKFLECIPDSNLPLPLSLSSLHIGAFPNLKIISCHLLPNLTTLTVHLCPEFQSYIDNCKSHPNLMEVNIQGCPMFVKKGSAWPANIEIS